MARSFLKALLAAGVLTLSGCYATIHPVVAVPVVVHPIMVAPHPRVIIVPSHPRRYYYR
jgi:hypothetical protein